jgi:hypothetical protein
MLELARRYEIKQILQVLYYRSNTWNPIEIDGDLVRIPVEVIKHFRDSKSIVKLNSLVPIEVLDREISNRDSYLQYVVDELQKKKTTKKIVFLDPDTGIEPNGPASQKHVLENELVAIWDSLPKEDVLVFYQHQRRIPDWINTLQGQFARTIRNQRVKRATAPLIAPDVVFFYAQKE